MGLESLTGGSVFIDDLVNTNPTTGDQKSEGDDHLRGIKNVLLNSFPGITGAVTSTHTELNILDGVTAVTADIELLSGQAAGGLTATELGYINTLTSNAQTQIDGKLDPANNLSDLNNAATARTNLGLGALAVLSSVDSSTIDANSVGNSELKTAIGTSSNSGSISNGSDWTPAAGFYNITAPGSGVYLELNVGGWQTSSISWAGGFLWCDGTNMRLSNDSGGAQTFYYQKLG